ncbi:riboflavin biosynthesis protein RibF [Leuconostoc rapi]|uniref:riboflavin biosynthesis protein RibF n=1 Tax=Leuconostoc rapi TaxID=1406906 RepID=UPI00195EEF03|nr:riboflavin biosynthesis protein RibF [Leuconostoc rapi]MBM7435649.1 riboflavin kinase/FMN adenylyltransferase [Leuconostoc rapi]
MAEIIRLHYPILKNKKPVRQVVAMGFFDGVHRGHQAVIERAKSEADKLGVPLAILTYDPYPAVVFKTLERPLRYLTPLAQKKALLTKLGVDTIYVMQFTSELSKVEPQQFVDDVLMCLNPVAIVGGFDHVYGGNSLTADMAHLPFYAQHRFDVIVVPKFDDNHKKIGSSAIRRALDIGDMNQVNQQLGRVHQTTGLVVHGEARGRKLGFPTINIKTPELEWLPGIGIYAVKVKIGDDWYEGMASIGHNITFGDERPVTVEINILDFKREIYGENVTVAWYDYLRGEVKFSTVADLIVQLNNDEYQTRQYFDGTH